LNRAVRRQQLKDPKREKTPGRAIPRTSAPAGTAARKAGGAFWRPRWIMDIISELRKVVWPTREDVVNLTIVVVVVTVIIGAVLGGVDIAFGWLIDKTLLN
jgi:preprotein translocase subunit SecE